MEPADRRILTILQSEGRISNQELADAAGMSTSACWRRVRLLEESGVIQRYAAIVDPDACGLAFHAVVHVSLSRHDADYQSGFVDAVQKCDAVLDCFATTGDADYHLRVRCADKEDYNQFLEEFLFQLPGIQNVKTNLVLKEIKQRSSLPLSRTA